MDQGSIRDAMIDHLAQNSIPHVLKDNTLSVLDNLWLSEDALSVLPDDLTVLGTLNISGTRIPTLPARLCVRDAFYMADTQITCVPSDLSVGKDFYAPYSQLAALPPGLCVSGILDISNTPIASLPEGLDVADSLSLSNTMITRFPTGMRVHGPIYPPDSLRDIATFMARQPNNQVHLGKPATAHQALALRTQLREFPDLWQVVQGMPMYGYLDIQRKSMGQFDATVRI